jgi:hypothetical protein
MLITDGYLIDIFKQALGGFIKIQNFRVRHNPYATVSLMEPLSAVF